MAKELSWVEAALSIELPPEISAEAWADFVELRKLKRAPLTVRASRRILEKLMTYLRAFKMKPEAVLNQSVDRAWIDVYPLKNQQPDGDGAEVHPMTRGAI